jgi:transposase
MHAYRALVESYRTERGPRQRVVSYLGSMDGSGRLGVRMAAEDGWTPQGDLFAEQNALEWVQVKVRDVRVDRTREFGGPWLGLQVAHRLGLIDFLNKVIPSGREEIPWSSMALVLILCRLLDPSSELQIAESIYQKTAISDLLGVPDGKVNDDRLYRAMDKLLPHKTALEKHLSGRLGELFDIEYDLLLYDVTSTYFEGQAEDNDEAMLGYSRDHRPDCKQVCIGLVVSRNGLPLGYEIFAGNTTDVTTVEKIVTTIEKRYGAHNRIWVMDRGMVSEGNLAFLRSGERRYILGTPKSQLRQFEKHLIEDGWSKIRDGLDVKLCPSPTGDEVFVLCRSAQRREKEKAMHARFIKKVELSLIKLSENCRKQKRDPLRVSRQIGRLLGQNTRAAGLFSIDVRKKPDGGADVVWKRVEEWQAWAELSEGCYMLRSNVTDWSSEDLWRAYVQLTQAEAAFCICKSDLRIRPVWHQTKDRVHAHILICFLAYVLWKTLDQICEATGMGNSARKVLDELKGIQLVDVVLPTSEGIDITKRCVGKPTDHQAILLQHLKMSLPKSLKMQSFASNVVKKNENFVLKSGALTR